MKRKIFVAISALLILGLLIVNSVSASRNIAGEQVGTYTCTKYLDGSFYCVPVIASPTRTPTRTRTPTKTRTPVVTRTPTLSPTITQTFTITPTEEFTEIPLDTPTVTSTITPTNIVEVTPTFTYTPTELVSTPTFTPTTTVTATKTSSPTPVTGFVKAFPGVEGFGEVTIGGRGGTVYEVTNLNDSGTGSLRACVAASGPRVCVFKTGGTISLNSALVISNPFITIAGQTAPGGGITIKLGTSSEAFSTRTHDVIIRYLTIRPGPGGENHANQIAKNGTELYNIVIDHNSMSWGVDSIIETWYRTKNVTMQWNIVSEALDNSTHSKGAHSKGLMIGGYQGSENGGAGSENVSVLNNLMAHNAERNPLIQMCGNAQVINNLTYNPMWTFSHQQLNCVSGMSYVNWVNNFHKRGPSSTSSSDLKVIPSDEGTWSQGKVYLLGNIGPSRPNNSLPETNWVSIKSGGNAANIITTVPAPAPEVATTNAQDTYTNMTGDYVGNSRGLSCDGTWFVRRDAIDTRVINEVLTGTGSIIDNPSEVGGWVTIEPGEPCLDSDHDGMSDVWETSNGLNPNDLSDNNLDNNGNGYTNLEEYLNGTNPN